MAGTLVVTNRSEHSSGAHEATSAPPTDVYATEEGALVVVSECAGCLLDVSLTLYTGTEALNAVTHVAPMKLTSDKVDIAEIDVTGIDPLPFGLIIRTTVVDENTGKARDESLTFFGVIDDKGKLVTLTWTEFICARGFANCHDDTAGQWVVDLGLAIPSDEDREIKEGIHEGGE